MSQFQRQSIPLDFPIKGVSENMAQSAQPPQTTPSALNVMPFDTQEDRARGGQRPGLTKFNETQDSAGPQLLEKASFSTDPRSGITGPPFNINRSFHVYPFTGMWDGSTDSTPGPGVLGALDTWSWVGYGSYWWAPHPIGLPAYPGQKSGYTEVDILSKNIWNGQMGMAPEGYGSTRVSISPRIFRSGGSTHKARNWTGAIAFYEGYASPTNGWLDEDGDLNGDTEVDRVWSSEHKNIRGYRTWIRTFPGEPSPDENSFKFKTYHVGYLFKTKFERAVDPNDIIQSGDSLFIGWQRNHNGTASIVVQIWDQRGYWDGVDGLTADEHADTGNGTGKVQKKTIAYGNFAAEVTETWHQLDVRFNHPYIQVFWDGTPITWASGGGDLVSAWAGSKFMDTRDIPSSFDNGATADIFDETADVTYPSLSLSRITSLVCGRHSNDIHNGGTAEWSTTDQRASGQYGVPYFFQPEAYVVETNQTSGRYLIRVLSGDVSSSKNFSTFTAPSSDGTGAFNTSLPIVNGVTAFNKFWMCSGNDYKYFDPELNTVNNWDHNFSGTGDTLGDVQLPGGDGSLGENAIGTAGYTLGDFSGVRAKLISRHMGRIVLSGKSDEPQNWWLSAIAEPDNWKMSGGPGAIKGSATNFGEIGDIVTALISFNRNTLIFGCDSEIWAMVGDPGTQPEAAQLMNVTREVGVSGGRSWCPGPGKSILFFGNGGMYMLQPNQFDITESNRISAGRMDTTFENIDSSQNDIQMMWDPWLQGAWIFVVPVSGVTPTHFFWDSRTDSFWPIQFSSDHYPTRSLSIADPVNNRNLRLLGGSDGYLRYINELASDDDSVDIDSHVVLGPLFQRGLRDVKISEVIGVLGENSGDVSYSMLAGDTPEAAVESTSPIFTGTWSAGRNDAIRDRARGNALALKLEATSSRWSMESIDAVATPAGRVRKR